MHSIFRQKRYALCIRTVSYTHLDVYKRQHVEVVPIDYTYSFGNQKHAKTNRNKVQEYLFVGFDGEDVWKKK